MRVRVVWTQKSLCMNKLKMMRRMDKMGVLNGVNV